MFDTAFIDRSDKHEPRKGYGNTYTERRSLHEVGIYNLLGN